MQVGFEGSEDNFFLRQHFMEHVAKWFFSFHQFIILVWVFGLGFFGIFVVVYAVTLRR